MQFLFIICSLFPLVIILKKKIIKFDYGQFWSPFRSYWCHFCHSQHIYFQTKHASIMQNTLLDFIIIVSLIRFFLFEKLYEKHEIWLSAILNPHFDLIIMDQRRLLENRRLVVHHMHFELLTYLTPFFSRAQHIFVSDTAHFNHD